MTSALEAITSTDWPCSSLGRRRWATGLAQSSNVYVMLSCICCTISSVYSRHHSLHLELIQAFISMAWPSSSSKLNVLSLHIFLKNLDKLHPINRSSLIGETPLLRTEWIVRVPRGPLEIRNSSSGRSTKSANYTNRLHYITASTTYLSTSFGILYTYLLGRVIQVGTMK